MPTNLDLDDKLIKQAVKMGGHASKTEAVMTALQHYVKRRNRLKLIELFGKVPFRADYDYKALRYRKRR